MSGGLLDLLSAAALDEDTIDKTLDQLDGATAVARGHDDASRDAVESAQSLDIDAGNAETASLNVHTNGILDSLEGRGAEAIAATSTDSGTSHPFHGDASLETTEKPGLEYDTQAAETDGTAAIEAATAQEDVKDGAELIEAIRRSSVEVKEELLATTMDVDLSAVTRNPKVAGVKRKASASSLNNSARQALADVAARGPLSARPFDGQDRSRTRATSTLLSQATAPPHRRERPVAPNIPLSGAALPSGRTLPPSLSSILSNTPYSPEVHQTRGLPPLPPLPPAGFQTPTPLYHANHPHDTSPALALHAARPPSATQLYHAESRVHVPAHSRRSASAASPVQQAQTPHDASVAASRKRARPASQSTRSNRNTAEITPRTGTFPGGVNQRGRTQMPHSAFVAPERLAEDSGIIRCICPFDDDDGFTVQCDRCYGWLHGLCVGISADMVMPDDYICPMCDPSFRLSQADLLRAEQLQLIRRAEEARIRQEMANAAAAAELQAEQGLPLTLTGFAQSGEPAIDIPRFPGSDVPGGQPTDNTPEAAGWQAYNNLVHARDPVLPNQLDSLQPIAPGQHPVKSASPTGGLEAAESASGASQAMPGGISPTLQPLTANRRRKQASSNINMQDSQRTPGGIALSGSVKDRPSTATTPAASSAGTNKRKRASQAGSTGRATPAGANTMRKDALPPLAAAQALAAVTGNLNDNFDKADTFSMPSLPIGTAKDRSTARSRSGPSAALSPSLSMNQPAFGRSSVSASGRNAGRDYAGDTEEADSSMLQDDGLTDDDMLDDDNDWRYDPWQYDYTPCVRLRYPDQKVLKSVKAEMDNTVKRHRATLADILTATFAEHQAPASHLDHDMQDAVNESQPEGTTFRGPHVARSLVVRPTLLHLTSQRTASPDLSSGATTPIYSSAGASSALGGPVEAVVIDDLDASPVDNPFAGKARLAVKTIAPGSLVLAPAMCAPFSGQSAVQSSGMNPFPRPAVYGVFTSAATAAGTCMTFMYGEVVCASSYRKDPINQWEDLGVLKPFTRGLAQPWNLVLDQRRWGDETRFIRQGCHPNVHVKPVLLPKNDAASNHGAAEYVDAEVDGYELAFGLFALQDIPRREELVLPFDWADDHVLHTLPALLFSPDLIFPKMPRHTRTGETSESDEVPSTSSFPLITLAQRSQIAACADHIHWLSQLAASCCVTLLGNSVCACTKKRDCALLWLWKLAAFSEVPRKPQGGRPTPSDLDLVNVQAVLATALSLDEKAPNKAGSKGGRGKDKKLFKRRRADLGALVGLVRGWEVQPPLLLSAIPPPVSVVKKVDHAPIASSPTAAAPSVLADIDREPTSEVGSCSMEAEPAPMETDLVRSPSPSMSINMQDSASEELVRLLDRKTTASRKTKMPASPRRRNRKPKVQVPPTRIPSESSSSESDLTEPLPSAGSSDEASGRRRDSMIQDGRVRKSQPSPRKSPKKRTTNPSSPVESLPAALNNPAPVGDGPNQDQDMVQSTPESSARRLGPHLEDLFTADLRESHAEAIEHTQHGALQIQPQSNSPQVPVPEDSEMQRPEERHEAVQSPTASLEVAVIESKPVPPPLRRLSFKAYQQRNTSSLIVPKSVVQGSSVPEEGESMVERASSHFGVQDNPMDSPIDASQQQTPLQEQANMASDEKTATADIDRAASAPKARMSFAAYRHRLSTGSSSEAALPSSAKPAPPLLPSPALSLTMPQQDARAAVPSPASVVPVEVKQLGSPASGAISLPSFRATRAPASVSVRDVETVLKSVPVLAPDSALKQEADVSAKIDISFESQAQDGRDLSSSPAKSVGEVLWPSPPASVVPLPGPSQSQLHSNATGPVPQSGVNTQISSTVETGIALTEPRALGDALPAQTTSNTSVNQWPMDVNRVRSTSQSFSHDKSTDSGFGGREVRPAPMPTLQPRAASFGNTSNVSDDLPYQRSSRSPPVAPRNAPTGPRNPAWGGRGRGWSPPQDRDRGFERKRDEAFHSQRMDRGASSEFGGRGRGDRDPPSGPRGWQGRGDSRPSRGSGRGGFGDRDRFDAAPFGQSSMGQRDQGWGPRARGRGRGSYQRG